VVFRAFRQHHAIHQNARHLHLVGIEGTPVRNALHLGNDNTPRIVGGHGHGLGFQGQGFPLQGDIAVRIGGGAPDQCHLDGEGLVEQVFFPVDVHHPHPIPGGHGVKLAAAEAGVHKGAQANPGQGARLARCNIPEQVGNHALGQVPGFDAVFHRQLLQLGHQAPVAAHRRLHQTFVGQMVQALVLAIPLPGGKHQGQIGRAGTFPVPFHIHEIPFHRLHQGFHHPDADKTAHGHRIPLPDQFDGFIGRNHFAFVRGTQGGGRLSGGLLHDSLHEEK